MAFLGMRGTGDWPEGAIPENWREAILFLYPNGDAPLTAVMSMLGAESTDSPTFNWFSKGLPEQDADVEGIFLEPSLSTEYTNGAAIGDVLYVNLTAEDVEEFRVGHEVSLDNTEDARHNTIAKVVGRAKAGAASYLAVKLLEEPHPDYDLDEIDYIAVIGSINPEGATMPDAIAYDPVQYSNHTQIFRTPLSITRTAKRTRLRYGTEAYKEAKREALELHAIEMEWAFLFGERWAGTGSNGKPERTTRGLVKALQREFPDHFVDYRFDPDFAGQTWLEGGKRWLNIQFEKLSTYSSGDRLALSGSEAGMGLTDLADAGSDIVLTPTQTDYGISVNTWVTPHITVHTKKSALFSRRKTTSHMMLLTEPRNLRFRYIDDTFFIEDPEDRKNRNNSKDATEEEFLTEAGLEYHHLPTHMVLLGVGRDNELAT